MWGGFEIAVTWGGFVIANWGWGGFEIAVTRLSWNGGRNAQRSLRVASPVSQSAVRSLNRRSRLCAERPAGQMKMSVDRPASIPCCVASERPRQVGRRRSTPSLMKSSIS